MNEQEQSRFDGWAVVDVLGHQRYVGYVRTEAYGAAVLFRVDVPELPEREYTLTEPQYVTAPDDTTRWMPKGTKVKRDATPGYTKLIGAGSIYSITPCDEAAALKAIEANQLAELKLVTLPEGYKALPAAAQDDEQEDADYDIDPDEDEEDDGEEDLESADGTNGPD